MNTTRRNVDRPKPGSVIAVPLPRGGYGYIQCLNWLETPPYGLGALVRALDFRSEVPVGDVAILANVATLFGPIFAAVKGGLKKSKWAVIGQLPLPPFEPPTFRRTLALEKGKHSNWRLIRSDGTEEFVGELDHTQRQLEMFYIHGYESLARRLETGQSLNDLFY